MAYKPPKQTIIDNDLKGVPSNEAVFEGLKLKLPKPSIDGTSGQLLSRGATADDTSWVNPPGGLPSGALEHQVLVYDGAAATWAYAGLGDGGLGTGNVVLGRSSLITTGINNTVIGVGATGITTSNGHVLIGSDAAITSGDNAVSIGRESSSRTGSVAVGQKAICSAAFAVAIGQEATAPEGTVSIGHFSQSTGTYSVAIGQGSSASNGSAVAIGYEADTNERCINVGAVSRSGSGTDGTFVGYFTGKSSATGANNTTIGSYTGNALSSGASNVFVGKDAGKLVTEGSTNIFIGSTAGDAVTTGSNNTIIGDVAGTTTLANTLVLATGTTERIRHDDTKCAIQTGDLSVETVGKGLAIKSGTNAKIGTAQFTAQTTVTVNTTAVTSNSLIFVTGQDGVDNYAVQNKVAGTSFEIHHNGGNVTALVAWMIVEATP